MVKEFALLGATPLSLETVVAVADGAPAALSPAARDKLARARAVVDSRVASSEPVYGITTGFGALAEVAVNRSQLTDLQRNLILSHAAGVGRPLSRREVRAMMILRAQTLVTGHSGVRIEVVEKMLELLNRGVHPVVPEKGSVGASGDLAPLAHLALAMIGEGNVEYEGKTVSARKALNRAGLIPLTLEAKEGLSLVNGTQGMGAVGSLALVAAERLCQTADVAGAMTFEGLAGIPTAFDQRVMAARPHPGQAECAENLRRLCDRSAVHDAGTSPRVQDPYSLRCMPQVHGASRDALRYVRQVLECEINSATDNPLVFPEDDDILSCGNFHGQPVALALDFAAIAVAELANISERRIEQLVNPALSGLPPFLVEEGGVHSGYMVGQVTAASLVNENKVLATPASVDSIPGSASREDHVSMGMTSARKFREVVRNTTAVLAVELLCAAQAIDLRGAPRLGAGTVAAYDALREVIPKLTKDRYLARDIEAATKLVAQGTLVRAVAHAIGVLR